MSDTTQHQAGMSRRQLLRRSAAAGVAVWAVPTIMSTTAYAAGTLGSNICPRKDNMRYQYYTASGWTWDVCEDPNEDPSTMPDGRNGNPQPFNPANVVVVREGQNNIVGTFTNLTPGSEFTIQGVGNQNPNLRFYIGPNDGSTTDPTTLTASGLLSSNLPYALVHVSCSQPLCIPDIHGYFRLLGAFD